MRRSVTTVLVLVLLAAGAARANLLDKLKELEGGKDQPAAPVQQSGIGAGQSESTISAGLKEALTIGSQKAVKAVAKQNGYFGNPAIRIPLPDKVRSSEKVLRNVGLGKQVDEFELTMNRAAEKAAPAAKDILVGAVKEMSIADAVNVLRGGDTAATQYMRSKTYVKLYGAFKPAVTRSVLDVGVTKAYQQLVDEGKKLRLVKDESMDLDHYVTTKALDGLFVMLGEEEKKIRKDPAAQVTDLLKKVFGK